MRHRHLARLPLLLAGLLFLMLSAHAVAGPPDPAGKPQQAWSHPWLVRSTSFLMVQFQLDREDVAALLPPGLSPQADAQGKVNATLEMYATERIAGLPGYRTAFVVVDVADHPSRAGTPGHFALWGRVDHAGALDFFRSQFGFPYELAQRLEVEAAGGRHGGVVGDGGTPALEVRLEAIAAQPVEVGGVVDMLAMHPDAGLVRAEVPYLSRGHFARVETLRIDPQGDRLLALLAATKPAWALVADDQSFAYSHVVVVE